jgi:hypothetical protein
METVYATETSVSFKDITRRYIPEDYNFRTNPIHIFATCFLKISCNSILRVARWRFSTGMAGFFNIKAGFRGLTTDQIFYIRQILEKKWDYNAQYISYL